MTQTDPEMTTDQAEETKLIARIQAGDKSACDECIALHSPAINRLLLRLLGLLLLSLTYTYMYVLGINRASIGRR